MSTLLKGQGSKPKLDTHDLRSLDLKNLLMWAKDYCGNPLSRATIQSYIDKRH